ncbi:Glutamate-cysteine_ligase [Hexamita inflata]|uniref:Glutamate--cysteine ligase n=1 Tax=Hexamita inflata TaxID=28002 RepID=A0AA86TA37_9EUKA|nr:Glutamate-cysteine ligase [Hexamita inflata]
MQWGYELETLLIKFEDMHWKLHLDVENSINLAPEDISLSREFAKFQLEAMPSVALSSKYQDILKIATQIQQVSQLRPIALLTSFPRLGRDNSLSPLPKPANSVMQSTWLSDEVITQHPRFHTLAANIRLRRGQKVQLSKSEMDAMAFGMGMCGLQITLQCYNETESRYIYDQLQCIAPVMLAVSAATPVAHGRLLDVDCRYSLIGDSVDDRTNSELQNDVQKRFGACNCFLSDQEHNDYQFRKDEKTYEHLINSGIDHLLAQHVSGLFARYPLVVYEHFNQVNDSESTAHFDQFQTTNWQICRWKPPVNGGWKVEFRPMEMQASPKDNAALISFIYLFTRAIRAFDLDLYVNQTQIHRDLEQAQQCCAAQIHKFTVHANPFGNRQKVGMDLTRESDGHCDCKKLQYSEMKQVILEFRSKARQKFVITNQKQYILLTGQEMIKGNDEYPGLIPIIKYYLELCVQYNIDPGAVIDVDGELSKPPTDNELLELINMLDRVSDMSNNTQAQRMRQIIKQSQFYKNDRIINENINDEIVNWALRQQQE